MKATASAAGKAHMSKGNEGQSTAPNLTVSDVIQAFAAAMKQNAPDASLLTGMSQERLERVRGMHDKPLRQRVIKGKSAYTGATFDMVVLESRKHTNGRVVRLENYRHPKEAYLTQDQGGMLPDNANVWRDGHGQGPLSDATPRNQLTTHFLQWRYETFWKEDLARVSNGNPLRVEHCVDGSFALEVPWQETILFSEDSAEPARAVGAE